MNYFFEQTPPQIPFPNFKWQWACLQCTEGINDPVVLLGILNRMSKLEGRGLKYSSVEFENELIDLNNDLEGTGVNIDLDRRVGDRNIIRNSGQYWKALGLIPRQSSKKGLIELTPFGRLVANQKITQSEFAAATIMNLQLPNPAIQSEGECKLWDKHNIHLYPLKLILSITRELQSSSKLFLFDEYIEKKAYITTYELVKIIIPLSGDTRSTIDDYVQAIKLFRAGSLDINKWPDCCPRANDKRMAREFLLFLSYYGFLIKKDGISNDDEQYYYNFELDDEIVNILNGKNLLLVSTANMTDSSQLGGISDIASDVDRKRANANNRGSAQAIFRHNLFSVSDCCIIT